MKSRILLIMSALTVLVMFSGCAFLKGPLLETLLPDPTATSIPYEMTPEADDNSSSSVGDDENIVRLGTASVEIINQSDYAVCFIYVTSSEDEYWGGSQLAEGEEILPGDTYSFELPDGLHDVLVQTCDEETLASEWELNESTTITVGGEGLMPVVVDNQSKLEVCYLYIADTDADYWEDDVMGLWETIQPLGGKRIVFVKPGDYDLLASDCDDQDIYWDSEIAVYEATDWIIDLNADLPDHQYDYGGSDMMITLNNDTDMDWCYVYISPGDADTWGADWLKAEETIDAGRTKRFSVVAGEFDVSITACDNSVVLTAWELSEDSTLEVSSEDKIPLRVINWHDEDICFAYIDPQDSDDVGENWLPGWEVIYGYSGKRTFYVAPGTYELTFEDCSGNVLEQASDVELYEESSWVVASDDETD